MKVLEFKLSTGSYMRKSDLITHINENHQVFTIPDNKITGELNLAAIQDHFDTRFLERTNTILRVKFTDGSSKIIGHWSYETILEGMNDLQHSQEVMLEEVKSAIKRTVKS